MTTAFLDLGVMLMSMPGSAAPAEQVGAPGGLGGIGPDTQQLLANLLLAFGVVVFVLVMLRVLRNRRHKVSELDRDPTERIEEIRHQAESRRDPVDRAMSDAEAFARRMSATLDAHAVRLELLIEDAERVARRLETALERSGSSPTSDGGEGGPAGPAAAAREARVSGQALARARLEQLERERAGREASPARPDRIGNLREDVFRLADRGLTAREIAGELDHPQGEVELILNLRRSG